MRNTLLFLLIVAVALLCYWKYHSEPKHSLPSVTTSSQSATPRVTQPAQPSEANWMKRSLDRARDVAGKVREKSSTSQDEQ
jgi:hypothetical protein